MDGLGARGARLQLLVPPDPKLGRAIRGQIAAYARAAGVVEADLTELLVAVGEALANAIEHSGTTEPIEVSAWVAGEDLIAQVVDHGAGFVPDRIVAPRTPREAMAERGRGLLIMSCCADAISVQSGPGRGTAVTLSRHLRSSLHR